MRIVTHVVWLQRLSPSLSIMIKKSGFPKLRLLSRLGQNRFLNASRSFKNRPALKFIPPPPGPGLEFECKDSLAVIRSTFSNVTLVEHI